MNHKNVNTFLVKDVQLGYTVDGRKKNPTIEDHIKGIMRQLNKMKTLNQDISLLYPLPKYLIKEVISKKLVGLPKDTQHPDFWEANAFKSVVDIEITVELDYNL